MLCLNEQYKAAQKYKLLIYACICMGHYIHIHVYLSFTEILHLKNIWGLNFSTYFKMRQCVIWTITPSWVINVAIVVFKWIIKNSKHHKLLIPTAIYRGNMLNFEVKNRIFYHLKYKNVFYNYQIYDVNYIKTKKAK